MTKKRLDEIIENVNKNNILQSCCGGMSSYDCMISELLEYTLNLREEKENLIKYLEDKIKGLKIMIEMMGLDIQHDDDTIVVIEHNAYQDILERIKSGKYE